MPSRTQITRHDCVEGWSCIAQWTGVQLSRVLDQAGVKPAARYVVFHCYDAMPDPFGEPDYYYESVDLFAARHPQTILAYGLNGRTLPIPNGAPLRVRIEQQLGYKMAKYIRAIEVVDNFAKGSPTATAAIGKTRVTIGMRVREGRLASEHNAIRCVPAPSVKRARQSGSHFRARVGLE